VARPGISYDDVKKAAAAIHEQGAAPSIQRVREWLGTGSNSTIAEHLKRWQQELSATPQLALPPAVPEAVLQALDAFWQVAITQAQTSFQQEREQAQLAVAKAQQERAVALTEKDSAEQQAIDLHKDLTQLTDTLRQLQDTLLIEQERRNVAENAIAAAQQQAEAAAQAAAKVRQKSAEAVAQVEKRLRQVQNDHVQALSQAEQRFITERERGEASENRLMQLLDQQRNDLAQARQHFDKQQDAWQAKGTHLRHKLDTCRGEINQMQVSLASAQERNTLWENQLDEQRKTHYSLEKRYIASIQEIERLRSALALSSAEKQQLRDALAACQTMLDKVNTAKE
jgi:chromosome segregation ATPase